MSVLIALDLDGTLEDSRDDMVAAAHRVRTSLGLPPRADARVRPWVNKGMPALYANVFDDFDGDSDPRQRDTVRLAYEADYTAHVADSTRLYDGVGDALARLAELGTLACVTNKPEAISRRLLEVLGVGELFATVVGGDTAAEAKPSALMIRTAVKRCGMDAPTVVMVGDSAGDLKMARAYGARSVWCAWGYADAPGELAPDARAERPEQLPEVVAGLL